MVDVASSKSNNPAPAPSRNGTPHRLDRTTFSVSRAAEYFEARCLQAMTGQPSSRFPEVVVKELLDNALDAAEAAGRAPAVVLRLRLKGRLLVITVTDNGDGIPPEVVAGVADFGRLVSDKAAYRSPTRGGQGNALKTVLGIPVALGVRAPVVFEGRAVRHRVRARIDPAGQVLVDHGTAARGPRAGTRVTLRLPAGCCGLPGLRWWARAFSLFNPHASVRIRQDERRGNHANQAGPPRRSFYRPTVAFPDGWAKFLPTDPTSPHWYDAAAMERLVFSHVGAAEAGGKDLTLRDFVRQFRGLSSTQKAKAVCDRFPRIRRVGDFREAEGEVARLLGAMKADTRPPGPDVLGSVGEEHFFARLHAWFGVRRWWYKSVRGEAGGVAFVVEVALAVTQRRGRVFHGVNFSPTFDDPLAGTYLAAGEIQAAGIGGFLSAGHALPSDETRRSNTAVAFHLVCPALEFLHKGKTRLKVPAQVAEAAGKATWLAAKEIYQEEERRKKDAARQEAADRRRERAEDADDPTLVEAVWTVMKEAVKDAVGGLGCTSAHNLFYAVRPLIQKYTPRELKPKYFEQKLLPRYQREVGVIPEIYYEPRGVLYEPHTGRSVPLGTREVESYVFPAWLYDKILFVEKTGVWPLFRASRIAERYDMAVVAGEGYATEACRVLFASASKEREYQLFVVHDADPHGYNIARTLREETERMPGYRVAVIDLGLKLGDALKMGLPTEEFTRKKELPSGLVLDAVEREHFRRRQAGKKSWVCRRVELNALKAGLIDYVEEKLRENHVRGKVVPPPGVLQERLRGEVAACVSRVVREAWEGRLQQQVDRVIGQLGESIMGAGAGLGDEVKALLAKEPLRSWGGAVASAAGALVDRQRELLERAIGEEAARG